MKRVLTGLQPSGNITIGNYLGSIKQMVEYQNKYDSFIFIADLHAITVPQNPELLHRNTRELIALYIACGVDPKKNTIYIQSENIYHTALSWILECLTPYGELGRMTQFKDKTSNLYDADYVPVGLDQTQHVEFARDIARRFNSKYGETFKIPEAFISEDVSKIMDLQNPVKKMSKSSSNFNGVIFLLDDEKNIIKKIKQAVTDSIGIIEFDPENRPGISNLISLYSGLANINIENVVKKYKDVQYGIFKKELIELAIEVIRPIQRKYYELNNNEELDLFLDEGKKRTLELARNKYEQVKKKVGFYR